MIKNILLVGAGGGIGSIARYLCGRWISDLYPGEFPAGTFAVNIAGCFLIGLFFGLTVKSAGFTNDWRLLLMTGLCGGFTTFSAFTLESIQLIKQDKTGLFFLYIAGSVMLGLLATFAGVKLFNR
jgi:fluoride exporter